MDVQALQRDLEAALDGEVRFDAVTRALYSTDASVYQIDPTGVVVPKSRDDVIRAVAICRKHRCPITMRGGGTSQAGQAIGEGLQIDTSKYFNRVLEVNVEERWARIEPGIVLDELNAALKPHNLRFAPDISTASRATIGGMMANNSSGARSVLYGKTIDHVLEQHVILSDGSIVHFRPLSAVAADAIAQQRTFEGACYREVRRLAHTHAAEIDRRFPKVLRRVGGYNLDAFVDPTAPVNLSKLMVGSEGTLGVVLEAKVALVPLPKAKAVMAIQFADLLEALQATPAILAHHPSAIEVMDGFILAHTRQSPALDRMRRTFIDGDPAALLCVEMYADDIARFAAAPRRARARSARATVRLSLPPRARRRDTGQRLGRARGGARPVDGDEGRRQVAVVRRGHGGRAGEAARLHRPLPRRSCASTGRPPGVYAHASVGCLHVRPVVNMKTEAGVRTFEALATDVADLVLEFGGALSGEHGDGLVRSPFMEKMFGPVLYQAFRDVKQTFDPDNLFNPGKIVDAPKLTPNLRYGPTYKTAAAADLLRLRRLRRHGWRRRDVQRPRRVPQDARRHHVPVVHGDAR